jgi:hypothetical protein
MTSSKPPTDTEIDSALAAEGIVVPSDMKIFIRQRCRALKLLALQIAAKPLP